MKRTHLHHPTHMKLTLVTLPISLLTWLGAVTNIAAPGQTSPQRTAQESVQQLVQTQMSDMVHGRLGHLSTLYQSTPLAQQALQAAEVRSRYLTNWAALRRIRWTGVSVMVRTPVIRYVTPQRIYVRAIEREAYHYHYINQPHIPLSFGIASRHHLTIVYEYRQWRFAADDFVNPVSPGNMAGQAVPNRYGGTPNPHQLSPNRKLALEYANVYCGNAPGCGNDGLYNPQYPDYNDNGGDCTNWISQVLLAGGFPMTRVWYFDQATHEGSAAWANAGSLAQFLRSSGRATEFAGGTYADITRPADRWPDGAIESLRPGDLISYEQYGRIQHTAVVIGYDLHGVPLTNTHSNDRYHVPWDFGWNTHTRFYLWHVHYPPTQLTRTSAPNAQWPVWERGTRHDHNLPRRPTKPDSRAPRRQ